MVAIQRVKTRLNRDNIHNYILDLTHDHESLIEYEMAVFQFKKEIRNNFLNGSIFSMSMQERIRKIIYLNQLLDSLLNLELVLESQEIATFYD